MELELLYTTIPILKQGHTEILLKPVQQKPLDGCREAAEEEDQHHEQDAEPGQPPLLGLTEDPGQQGQAGASKNHQ